MRSTRLEAIKRTLIISVLVYFPCTFVLALVLDSLFFTNLYPDLPSLLRAAIPLALGVSIGAGIGSYFEYKNLYNPAYAGTSAIDRVAYIELRLPYPQAFDLCLDALNSLGKPHVLLEDRKNGQIEAVIRPRKWWEYSRLWEAWFLRVSIRLGSDQEGSTKIMVACRSGLPLRVLDVGGTFRRNLGHLVVYLRTETERRQVGVSNIV